MANLLVIVSYKIFPPHMGGQKGIVKFYEHLQKHHSVYMAVSFDNEVENASFWVSKLVYANWQMGLNVLQLFRLRRTVRNRKIDCLIAEHSYTGWIALLLRHLTGKPFIIHSHNIEAHRFRLMKTPGWRFYRQHEGWIHRHANFSFFKTKDEKATALKEYSLAASDCAVVPYGIDDFRKVADARATLAKVYGIGNACIFYFNGTLDCKPNADAVENLILAIQPLLEASGLDYRIVVSGKRIPLRLRQKVMHTKSIRYLGFVEDLETLYQGCTLFLNPVVNDSGVKTKVIEALGNHCTVVSTKSGAAGIPKELCGSKLIIAEDNDWNGFVKKILDNVNRPFAETPPAFFHHFSWKHVARTAAEKIDALVHG